MLGKLYLFFIINNLLVFTIASTLVGLYTKISATVQQGNTVNVLSLMRSNLNLLAKSLTSKLCRTGHDHADIRQDSVWILTVGTTSS